MIQHSSVVSGSTAGLRLKCSGSRVTSAKVPSDDWNVYAATGTAIHKIVEDSIADCLTDQEMLDEFVGQVIEEIDITEEHIINKAIPAVNYFDKIVSQDAHFELEQKVSLKGYVEGGYGYTDVLFYDDRVAGILDHKFGDYTIVRAENNDALRFYLVAAILTGKLPKRAEYEAHIFQPSVKLDPDDYASKAVYTHDELFDFLDDLVDALEAPIQYNVGPHCKGCKGRVVCSAFMSLTETNINTDVKGLDLKRLKELYELVPALNKLIEDIKSTAIRNATNGMIMPGYTTETAKGNRKYIDEDAAWLSLGRLGIPAKERTESKPISPAKAEKILKAKGIEGKKINRFLSKHVVRDETGLKLVKTEDAEDYVDTTASFKMAENLLNA